MPYNPVVKYPLVMNNMLRKGYAREVSHAELERAIIEELGIVRTATINNCISTMGKLGLISEKVPGVFFIGKKKKASGPGENEMAAVDAIASAAKKK